MIKLEYAIACETAFFNKQTEQVSIINVVNGVRLPKLPMEVKTLFLVMSWQRSLTESAEEEDIEVRTHLKTEEKLKEVEYNFSTIRIPKDRFVLNTITRLGIKFTTLGENRIVIEQRHKEEWRFAGSVMFKVALKT